MFAKNKKPHVIVKSLLDHVTYDNFALYTLVISYDCFKNHKHVYVILICLA